jgi:selenocysteine-specific elongation factor
VIDPFPAARHKRFDQDILNRLASLEIGTPEEILAASIIRSGIGSIKDIVTSSGLEQKLAMDALKKLIDRGELVLLENKETHQSLGNSETLVTSHANWDALTWQINETLERYHKENPLRRGIPREELKSRLKQPIRLFNLIIAKLVGEGFLVEVGNLVAASQHRVSLTPQQAQVKQNLLGLFEKDPFSPPSVKKCQAQVGEELYNALLEAGELIQVSPEVVFDRKAFKSMVNGVKELIQQRGKVSTAEVRDQFATSRKYVLALLEYLDKGGVTVREWDVRRLKDSGD